MSIFENLGTFPFNNEKNKNIFIAGDFNFDLIKASAHQSTSDFYDMLSTNFLLPMILLPTKINTIADTLIEIFSLTFSIQISYRVI